MLVGAKQISHFLADFLVHPCVEIVVDQRLHRREQHDLILPMSTSAALTQIGGKSAGAKVRRPGQSVSLKDETGFQGSLDAQSR
jgi:hypothetical protein